MERRTVTTMTLCHRDLKEAVVEWIKSQTAGEVLVDINQIDFLDDDGQPFEFDITAEATD